MICNIIRLRPIFCDLDLWQKRQSQKNGITFPAIKRERLIFTKIFSGKKFLESYKYQNEWQHHRTTTNICWPSFWPKRTSHKNGITFQAIKWERLIFMKNVSVKIFLVCYENQNECQHRRATTYISRTWFLAEKDKSKKRKYVSGRKIRKTHFHEKYFR